MTDVEQLVRATLRQHADDAPLSNPDLPESIRAKRHRRMRWQAAGASLSVLAVLAACVGIGVYVHDSQRASTGPIATPSDSEPTRTVAFHGIEIDVPASWKINDTRCNTPVRDTVIVDQPLVSYGACRVTQPPGTETVFLSSMAKGAALNAPKAADAKSAHGVTVRVGMLRTDPRRLPQTLVGIPAAGVELDVTAATATTRRLIASIRLARVTPLGCAMRAPEAYPSPLVGDLGPAASLAPPQSTSVTICHYRQGEFASEMRLRGGAHRQLVGVLDHLPPGFSTARVPSRDLCRMNPPSSDFYLLRFSGSGWPNPWLVWVHIGFCGKLGAFTPRAEGQLNQALVRAVLTRMHPHIGFDTNRRSLLPHAPSR